MTDPLAVFTPVFEAQPEGDGPLLFITRGLPASGKTTWALALIDALRGEVVRVNRDELRRGMLRAEYHQPVPAEEVTITIAQQAMVEALLLKSVSVIVDDTNLRARYVRQWLELARKCSAGARVVDFTTVPVDVCIERDRKREGSAHVGEAVIRRMHDRYLAGLKGAGLPIPELSPFGADIYAGVQPYTAPDHARHTVFLVDLDGTLALMNDRSPYDETRVGEDDPNLPVIEVVKALIERGLTPIYLSGRTDGCREATEKWLVEHIGLWHTRTGGVRLFMRKVGDQRPDWQVKLELFDLHIRRQHHVALAIDDRDQVVRLWRRLGLTCLQAADGDF